MDRWPRYRAACIVIALLAAIGVHLAWYLFVNTTIGQAIDRAAFEGALVGQSRLWQVGRPILDVVSRGLVVIAAVVAMIIGVLRRRAWLAVQAIIVIAGANITTQLIKEWYERPRLLAGWTGHNSLPSGHTTVVASVSIAMLLTVPRRWRAPTAIIGAVWTLLTGISTLVGRWHRPADVVAALLVVCFWGALAQLLGSRLSADPPVATAAPRAVTALVLAGLALIGALVATGALLRLRNLVQSQAGVDDAITMLLNEGQLTAYLGGIAAVMASVFGVFGVLLWLRNATLAPVSRQPHHDNLPEVRYGATRNSVYADATPRPLDAGAVR